MFPIFVINLDRDQKKWEAIQQAFASTVLKLQRFPAIEGKQYRNHPSVTSMCQNLCTNTMIGCFLSHQTLWKHIVKHQIPQALILEDDVKPCSEFETKLAQLEVPDFDLLLWGYHGDNEPQWHAPLKVLSWVLSQPLGYQEINSTVIRPPFASGTHAYMVSFTGAKKLLKHLPHVQGHVDLRMYRCPLTIYATKTPLVEIDTNVIQGKHINEAVTVKNMVLHQPWFKVGSQPITVLVFLRMFLVLSLLQFLFPKYGPTLWTMGIGFLGLCLFVWYKIHTT